MLPAMTDATPPRLLSIAGSDSGGGAGIQADLKAFAACGAHGMTAITAITVQNTVEVRAVVPMVPVAIVAQVRAITDDIGVDAVKVGMLGSVETIHAVAEALELVGDVPVVVDPVMVAESGARLLEADAIETLRKMILPRATVVTPNLPEARVLSGLGEEASAEQLARAVQALGSAAVVVTGGHAEQIADTFYDGDQLVTIPGERHPDGAAHGSGLHPLLGARGAARVRRQPAGRRAGRRRDRGRGGPGRSARDRRRRGAGRRVRARAARRPLGLSHQVPAHEARSW